MKRLASIRVAASTESWSSLGFTVVDGVVALANGALELGGAAPGIGGLGVDGLDAATTVDGLTVEPERERRAVVHPNGARSIDHIVIMTDSLDRTSDAIESELGLERRRLRETDTVRQAFHRFADPTGTGERGCIVELVEHATASRAEYWGLVVVVDDLDALHANAPDLVGPPKPAVQPGRRIATARRDADLGTAVAFMTP